MYEFDTELVANLVWKGDGEEPSQDALIEWFKVNHPAQASEVDRREKGKPLAAAVVAEGFLKGAASPENGQVAEQAGAT